MTIILQDKTMSISSIHGAVPVTSTPESDPGESSAACAVDSQGGPPLAPGEPIRQARAAGQSSSESPPAAPTAPMSATQFALAMVSRYDGGAHSRNEVADRTNTIVTLETAKLTMTGLPPAQTEMNLDEIQFAGSLAQMSEDKREQFAQRANALRTAPDSQYGELLYSLQSDVNAEFQRIEANPVLRMNAVFNAPAGISILGDDGQNQMAALRSEYARMNAVGATPAQRELAFAKASNIKSGMQNQILQKSQDVYATQHKLWSESAARVNQILEDAEKYSADTIQLHHNSDDPQWDTETRKPAYAKTFPYQSVMEKLLSPDGYSQQERGRSTPRTLSPEGRVRDLLTFQQGMSELGSDIHKRVMKLEQQALSTMAHPGPDLTAASPARTLSELAAHPPSYDKNYLQNLASGYQGVLKDFDLQNRTMLREPIPGLADKILYGVGRFLADLSPIPGLDWFANQLLDAEFPDHGGLTDEQVRYTDMGAMLFRLLIGRREPEGEGSLKPPVPGGGEHPVADATQIRDPSVSTPQTEPTGNASQGQPARGGVTASNRFTPGGMPTAYELETVPQLYGPSSTPGVYVDPANGQKFILADGRGFPVQYDKSNGTYRIYDRTNPTRPSYPVRINPATGKWEIHQNVGLQGGMDNGSSPSSGSQSPPPPIALEDPPFSDTFHVSTPPGGNPSPAMLETLDPNTWHSAAGGGIDNPAFIQRYRDAFNALPSEQRRAIRDWTHLDVGGDSDSDGYSTDTSYQGINYELNQQLYSRVHEAETGENARLLAEGLNTLPKPEGQSRLLRIADVAPDYATRFKPGDYVTNSPAFMSASTGSEYANSALRDQMAGHGPDHPVALYEIQAQSATPFITGVTTLADGESEWLFRPNTIFRVEEIATATPNDAGGTPRIGMRLVQVPFTQPVYAKNLHTGDQELVYPAGMQPVYTPLQPTTNPPLQPPIPQHPDSPPAPTAGDPNAPGPSHA
ncbi:hypothetical protein [Paraburkholderia aromaticivorans]|uniref:hypothetical protein n=1 Tax=Paraburkholderia aromaticivorans TaxID=2026199 RepID=UPI001455EB20|nr:hypothetical protein [Paraburkholderia aromaticivorans]